MNARILNNVQNKLTADLLKKQQETAERELNLLKVRKNDPYVNRGLFRVIINEQYKTNENRHNKRRKPTVD